MKAGLTVGLVSVFVAVWLYSAYGSWIFLPGLAIGVFLIWGFSRNIADVNRPSEETRRLARRGVALRPRPWGFGIDLDARAFTLERRTDGDYRGLALHWTDDEATSRVALEHAAPLNLGLFCDAGLPRFSEERRARPFGARLVRLGEPDVTCYAIDPTGAARLLRHPPVHDAFDRLQTLVGRLDDGAVILDDHRITALVPTDAVDDDLLAAMADVSRAAADSGLLPVRPAIRRPFLTVRGIVMTVVAALAGVAAVLILLRAI